MFKNQFPRNAIHFSCLIFIAAFFAVFFQAVPAATGSSIEDQFVKDIRQAVQSGKRQNFWKLFNMEGVDETSKASVEKHLVGPLMKAKLLKVSLEPLPEDFHTEYVMNGIRYRPNVQPLGLVKFEYKRPKSKEKSTASMLYGKKGSRYMLAGTIGKKLPGNLPPSKQIQVIVMGSGHPPVTFEGHMIYMQGGKPARGKIKDMGGGNQTLLVRGSAITYLKVRRTSAKGTLKVIIMEDEDTIFETGNLDTALPIVFKK